MTKNDNTSVFLKDCMAEAVMQLLEQWPLDKIQVKQICDVSGYRRMSWFRAFGSKHEAVSYHIVRLWQQWSERHGVVVRDFDRPPAEMATILRSATACMV